MDRSLPLPTQRPAAEQRICSDPDAGRPSHWPTLLLILGAGIASAFQVGKVPIVLVEVQQSLAIDLSRASWLLSAFALVGAALGVLTGIRVDAWGARRVALAGLVLQGLCSALGVLAPSLAWLLTLRVIEGVGFLAVVVAAPALIVATTPPQARPSAFAAWGMFMPLGMAAMMLTAPWIEQLGWRGLWAANGAVLLLYAVPLALGTRGLGAPRIEAHRFEAARLEKRSSEGRARETRGELSALLRLPGPWLIALLFALFTAMFFSIFGFLPSILNQRMGMADGEAGVLAAIVIVMSAIGNLVCGALLARGFAPLRLLAVGYLIIGTAAPGILMSVLPGSVTYGLALAVSLATGLIPVVLFADAPNHAPSAGQVGITMGMAMQGNNIGLLVGPAVAGTIAAQWGWPWVAAWVGVLAVIALFLVSALRRLSMAHPYPGGIQHD